MKFSWLKQWQTKSQIHGTLFDVGVFLGSWGLLAFDPDRLPDSWRGRLLLTAVSTQIVGAYLKRRSLPARLQPQLPGLFTRFRQLLLFLHFILFTVMTLLGLALIGWFTPDVPEEGWWVALSLAVGGLSTGLVYRAGRPSLKDNLQPNSTTEYAADALLWLSVLITTALMWKALFTDLGAGQGAGFTGRGMVLALSTSILFVVFYLPSRYLFLIEDYHHPSTWLRLWLVMLPLWIAIFRG